MIEIKQLPQQMTTKAEILQTGEIIFAYRDGTAIRMETENGRDTYVWRQNAWRRMRNIGVCRWPKENKHEAY